MQSLTHLSSETIQSLPLDRLGIYVLNHLVESNQWNSHNFLNDIHRLQLPEDTFDCIAEGLHWTISKNLVARGSRKEFGSNGIFITRLGHIVLERGLEVLQAIERVDLSLHELLNHVKSQFLLGEYELAAFAAMRQVEIRVRELSCSDSSLLGVKLMRESFRDGGKLADPQLDPGELVGIMELFAGAIGTFKNPPSHRQVDYADPTEASEVVLLADLLLRMLDRVAARLGNADSP